MIKSRRMRHKGHVIVQKCTQNFALAKSSHTLEDNIKIDMKPGRGV
jgi:hypothetical protein